MSRFSAFTHAFALLHRRLGAALLCAAVAAGSACAQETPVVPHLVQFSGTVADTHPGKADVVFALYKDQTDRVALWQETQSVPVDASGRYAVFLGAASADGIPADVFSGGAARWLGVTVNGQAEQPRMLLTSVPYAMKASDAETLGGLPASAFVRESAAPAAAANNVAGKAARPDSAAITATGAKLGYLPVFTDATGNLSSSLIAETSKYVGIGTASPSNPLTVAGVIQSSTGGFKFPDGTTQTTAVTLPVNWKGAAKVAAGLLNVTDTTSGPPPPTTSRSFQTLPAMPYAIVGTAAGHGTTVGVMGKGTGTGSSDLGIGLMGQATGSQGIGVVGYSTDATDMPTILSVAAAGSGKTHGYDAELFSPEGSGYKVNFNVPPANGTGFPGTAFRADIGNVTQFVVDGYGNINTSGGLTVDAPASLNAGLTVKGNLTVTGKIYNSNSQFASDHPLLSAAGAKAGYLSIFTDTAGDLGDSLVYQAAKNVGIGTATPANPLTVAGIIQSSTGGFKFPDGTTQTTAVSLPINWKGAAKAPAGLLTVTNTANGPAVSAQTSLTAIPSAVVGTSSGSGITAGVLGQVTSTNSSAFGIGLMGMVPKGSHGSALIAYSNDGNEPVVQATAAATSGSHTIYSADAYSPAMNGFNINYHTTPPTGTAFSASTNGTNFFSVDGKGDIWGSGGISANGNINTTGGLTVGAPANLEAGLTVKGNLTVTGKINGSISQFTSDHPLLSATGAAAGYLPVFTDKSGDLGDSLIFQTPKYVGIGTASPANPLSVAGIIQSTAGGFKFPDGTTQTTAMALPINWKGAAKAPAGVLNVTDTTNGPAMTKGQALPASGVPSAIVGTASGNGTVAGVTGKATGNDTTGLAVGVMGQATGGQGVAVLGYSSNTNFPAIMAYNSATSGSMKGLDVEMNSPAASGLGITFAVPTSGNMISAAVGMTKSPSTYFRVGGDGSISTSGSLQLGGKTGPGDYIQIQGPGTKGFSVDGSFNVGTSGSISAGGGLNVTGPASLRGGIVGGLTVNNGMTVNNIKVPGNIALEVTSGVKIDGDLWVVGKIQKGSGTFKIDHPLDPANKYLSHSFVESPDMMNIYNGNVVTDSHGIATVELPSYFEALNQDFRYQLTVIGQFAQAIVAKEIANNQFTIQTDKPAVKVSWQVTGIRHDAYAEAHRVVVEEDKPAAERGTYLHPELFAPAREGADKP